MKKYIKIAQTLVEALPYIKEFNNKVVVVKYGGSIGTDDFLKFAKDIILMKLVGIKPIVVHGGGPEISKVLKLKKIPSNFIDGLRVTCSETIKIVESVLWKTINKKIVNKIKENGLKSIGLCGKNKELLLVKKFKPKKNIDIGRVGEIIKVNKSLIKNYLDSDYIPVITPLGINKEGLIFNINADNAASKIASSLKAEKLIILTNVRGIKDQNNNLISSLTKRSANSLINKGIIEKGMVPKVGCLVDALTNGVKKAHIIDGRTDNAIILEMFTDSGIGTEILLRG